MCELYLCVSCIYAYAECIVIVDIATYQELIWNGRQVCNIFSASMLTV